MDIPSDQVTAVLQAALGVDAGKVSVGSLLIESYDHVAHTKSYY